MKKAGTESLKSAKRGVLCQGAVEKENQEESITEKRCMVLQDET